MADYARQPHQPNHDFLVSVPYGDTSARDALRAFAEDFGARCVSLVTSEDGSGSTAPEPVTEEMLASVSTELYDDPCYGNTAHSMLKIIGEEFERAMVVEDLRHDRTDLRGLPPFWSNENFRLGPAQMNPTVLQATTYGVINQAKPPFDIRLEFWGEPSRKRGREYFPELLYRVWSEQPNVERVAEYMTTLNQRDLTGSLGKAFNVLDYVGNGTVLELASTDDEQFVNVHDLSKVPGFTSGVITGIKRHLNLRTRMQIRTGQPDPKVGAEIIFEGAFTARNAESTLDAKAQVAVSSLVALAGVYQAGNNKAADLLRGLPDQLNKA